MMRSVLIFLLLGVNIFSNAQATESTSPLASDSTEADSIFNVSKAKICMYAESACDGTEIDINVTPSTNKSFVAMLNHFHGFVVGEKAVKIKYGECIEVGYAGATWHKKRPYLLYNNQLLTSLANRYKDDALSLKWILYGIIAHEFGHHLIMHPYYSRCGVRDYESQADYFAGIWLARMKASKENAVLALSLLAKETGDAVYRTKDERIQELLKGYAHGQKGIEAAPLYIFLKSNSGQIRSQAAKKMDYKVVKEFSIPSGDSSIFYKTFREYKMRDVVFDIVSNGLGDRQLLRATNQKDGRSLLLGVVTDSHDDDFEKMVYDHLFQFWYIDKNDFIYAPNKKSPSGFALIGKLN